MSTSRPFHLRLATPGDSARIRELIDLSVRTLHVADYSPGQIEAALGTVLGLDTQLIVDGTYFVAEAESETKVTTVIGCGGWSRRKTLFGGDHREERDDCLLVPGLEAAKIRAFFVHPQWTRLGIGSQILERCEQAAADEGYSRFELGATLSGERFFRVRGYEATERISVPLSNGDYLAVVRMSKSAGRDGTRPAGTLKEVTG